MSKCPNGSAPLLLPWTNATAAAGGAVLSRGITFTVGTPPQSFALNPSTFSNNLFVNNVAECVDVKNLSCIGQVGGVFDSSASTSFVTIDYANWGGSRDGIELASRGSYNFFEDAIAFGTAPATNKFAAYPGFTNGSTDATVIEKDTEPMTRATLPLGSNSTFLNFLADTGQASSRTYGLWVGSESEAAPQDGLLIVGGYDTARVKSPPSTFPMHSDCPTCAIVTAITYDKGGTSTTLFDNTTETLAVNLDPFSSTLELPDNLLENLAGAESDATWNSTLNRFTLPAGATLPTGTITITLSDANAPLGDGSKQSVATYKTTIPASELFYRPRTYSATGTRETFDPTIYELAVTNRTGSSIATFGLPFFTQNYLIVDPDAQNFQLAPAVTAPADPKAATVTTICRPPVKGSANKFGIGALAGAIVGSIIGTVLIIGLALWFRRRKAAAQRDSQVSTAVASSAYERMESGTAAARSARDSSSESKSNSIQLPLQQPPPLKVRQSLQTVGSDDPRRDLNRAIYHDIDDRNDGRLLDDKPTGLHETIHNKATLPRVAAEHEF